MAKRAARTRNGGTMTESAFWSMIRSTLRRRSMYWLPIRKCLEEARRAYKGENKRRKWEYKCNKCQQWYDRKGVEVDHVIEVGSLRCAEDLPGFVERLFCEMKECYVVLCKQCHKEKTFNK